MMILPEWARLMLYITVGVCPVWIDWITKTNDTTFRGLMMPVLSSLLTAATVVLARTRSPQEPTPPQEPTEP